MRNPFRVLSIACVALNAFVVGLCVANHSTGAAVINALAMCWNFYLATTPSRESTTE